MMSLSHLQSVLLCLVALSLFCLSLAVPPPFIQNRFRKSQPRKIFVCEHFSREKQNRCFSGTRTGWNFKIGQDRIHLVMPDITKKKVLESINSN